MPRHPQINPPVANMAGSVYSALAYRLRAFEGETYPLHIGDTWMEPAPGCRMEDVLTEEHPGMHRYAPTEGRPELVDAVVERLRSRTGIAEERENVLITAGATAGLATAVGAIVEPGDEVLILAPHWPLIAGTVRCFGGKAVQVPFIGAADSPESAVEAVREHLTDRTVALYLNTPNNPSGKIIPHSWLEALAQWARREDLWILADEVYEDYVYDLSQAGGHTYTRTLAPERTFASYSLSKAYGMSGNRCGYLAGPEEGIQAAHKVNTYTVYSTPTASQITACRALEGQADAWLATAREKYEELGRMAAAKLGLPAPQGSAFLFPDVAGCLDERGVLGFLERCADRGLLAAPGSSFGPYPTHIRVCFTCAEPDRVERGMDVLAAVIADSAG